MLIESTTLHQAPSPAKQRVIAAAADLFREHGYQAVSMRDVAQRLDIKQASLYYHVPQGKEQLYVEVTVQRLARHHDGLQCAIDAAELRLDAQLHAVARWFLSQPPLNLQAMAGSDMPQLAPENAAFLLRLTHRALFEPLIALFEAAVARGDMRAADPEQMAGCFLSLLEGITFAHEQRFLTTTRPQDTADTLIDVLLHGLQVPDRRIEDTP